MKKRKQKVFFDSLIIVLIVIILFLLVELISYGLLKVMPRFAGPEGIDLNKIAWENSYKERGLQVPENGPREGFWGSRIRRKKRAPYLYWIEPEIKIDNLLEVNSSGFQIAGDPKIAKVKILIIGGSVAFGAYASNISNTYFAQVHDFLVSKGLSVATYVLAAGAWKSDQEIIALLNYGLSVKPDIVVFVNGLNDLIGTGEAGVPYDWDKFYNIDDISTKRLLYFVNSRIGHRVNRLFEGLNTTKVIVQIKKHLMRNALKQKTDHYFVGGKNYDLSKQDYRSNIRRYLANMEIAKAMAHYYHFKIMYVLQPFCALKQNPSFLEKEILIAYGDAMFFDKLIKAYDEIRQGLKSLSDNQCAYFLDCSDISSREQQTVFCDLWHFSDIGHRLLSGCLLKELLPISTSINERKEKNK